MSKKLFWNNLCIFENSEKAILHKLVKMATKRHIMQSTNWHIQGIFCSVSRHEKLLNLGHVLIKFKICLVEYLYINDNHEVEIRH